MYGSRIDSRTKGCLRSDQSIVRGTRKRRRTLNEPIRSGTVGDICGLNSPATMLCGHDQRQPGLICWSTTPRLVAGCLAKITSRLQTIPRSISEASSSLRSARLRSLLTFAIRLKGPELLPRGSEGRAFKSAITHMYNPVSSTAAK